MPKLRRLARSTPLLLLLILLRQASGQYIPPHAVGMRRFVGSEAGVEVERERLRGRNDPNQDSNSRAMYLVSHSNFCLLGPPKGSSKISDTKLNVVSWCTDPKHGNRLIPDGTLKGVTYVKAKNWIQVSGSGDFTNINIAPGDQGGQFDSSKNTPDGAAMYVTDDNKAANSWVTLISSNTFCVRACIGDPKFCPAGYDEMGCYFFTSNGVGWDNVYQDCEADDGDPPGVVNGKTYTQGNTPVPNPSIPPVSNCQLGSSVRNGQTASPQKSGSNGGDNAQTSWVAVQTCVPCTATTDGAASTQVPGNSGATTTAATESTSKDGSNSGKTEQVGVTQMSSNSASGPVAVQLSSGNSGMLTPVSSTGEGSSTTAVQSSTKAALGGENGGDRLIARWLAERDEKTTTKDGQCCFTTWTPTAVGGATATNSDSSGGSQQNTAGSKSGSGTVSLSGTKTASGTVSGSPTGSASGSRGVLGGSSGSPSINTTGSLKPNASSNANGSGNGTNGKSGALGKMEVTGLNSGMGQLLWLVGATGMAILFGGLTLV
ncbi:uncharacterized protein L203_100085 [Cryptococcus depauperatus CBS 7841]|uniref:Uncharacterized protein n=1 Tax=Cryptococcus depauperatus CBS 7841 TaxID=1295531 RepID=A0A1E3J2A2_9TREE|nr:hypothetical protein L203_00256 [Cryptococcus depauperatus CBS 7841]